MLVRAALLVAVTVSPSLIAGCSCSDDDTEMQLRIVDPEDGAALTAGDDTLPGTPGFQYTVEVRADGFDDDEVVQLLIDDTLYGTTASVQNGLARFENVTFAMGAHRLAASGRGGLFVSRTISFGIEGGADCPAVAFTSPAADGSGTLTLGPDDDADGTACGESFSVSVSVSTTASEGTALVLLVNGVAREDGVVDGTTARFGEVVLENRGDTPNTLEVEFMGPAGVTCRQAFPEQILVDCEGASCRIAAPSGHTRPGSADIYLNASDDASTAVGFQTTVEVSTDSVSAGQPVRLIVDRDALDAREATATAAGEGAEASFSDVTFTEGAHRVQAQCRDASGNTTLSDELTWNVDVTACTVSVSAPEENETLSPDQDVDPETEGVQIDVVANAAGSDCVGSRVGLCSGIEGVEEQPLSGGSIEARVTLSASIEQTLCTQAIDAAGNVGEAQTHVAFLSGAPQLEIVTPAEGIAFSREGGTWEETELTADLNPSSTTCEAAFVVNCTALGANVTLHREGVSTPLAGGTAPCEERGGLPTPFTGQASFDSVSLPSVGSGESYNVVARQLVGQVSGSSDPVAVRADCEAPSLSIGRPTCPATLYAGSADANPSVPGIQYRTTVLNLNVPAPEVTLEIRSGDTVTYSQTSSVRVGGTTHVFENATYSAGVFEAQACAHDASGNLGCSASCQVTVNDLPFIDFEEPLDGALLSSSADCDTGTAGMQVQVRASTDAPVGSDATIQVGGGDPIDVMVVSGGTIEACVDAVNGVEIPLVVTATDSRGTGTGTVRITVDDSPPTDAIDTLEVASFVDRRRGQVRLQWESVEDSGGGALAELQLRCAAAPILDETAWAAAQNIPVSVTPGAGGTVQSQIVSGFRIGVARHCTIRGADPVGSLTPIGNDLGVTLDFENVTVAPVGNGFQMGEDAAAVGDVNGDLVADLLIGGNGRAWLYFGSRTGLDDTPNVTFETDASGGFGNRVASVGDFNGDGRGDFAIAAPTENNIRGAVYLFYGRPSSSPWPSMINVSDDGCGADICFAGTDTSDGTGPDELGFFGFGLSSGGDVNGDGYSDLVVGAPGANDFRGRLYILMGGETVPPRSIVWVPGVEGAEPNAFVLEPPAGGAQLGTSVAGLGDINTDGYEDIAIGAPGRSDVGPMIPGRLYTFEGTAYEGSGLVFLPSAELVQVASDTVGGFFAARVANIGDYDGNGRVDIGVYMATSEGRVIVYGGSLRGYSATFDAVHTNDLASPSGDRFGSTLGIGDHPWLGLLGDVDEDGFSDLIAGSTQAGTAPGRMDLFFGDEGLRDRGRSQVDLTRTPTPGGSQRRSVAYAGDLNGDGYTDLVIGDPTHGSSSGRVLIYY